MRIKIDISELTRLARVMSPEGSNFTLADVNPIDPIDIQLGSGMDIQIEDLDTGTPLLSYQGRQVLLYIRDHSNNFDSALSNPGKDGRKFHLSHCKTLEQMKKQNRYQRYVATNRLDSFFTIEDAGGWSGLNRTADVQLRVCQFCLQQLNYKNARASADRRRELAIKFSITDFFSHYSTCFKFVPPLLEKAASVGYTSDWSQISKSVREVASYRCNECHVDLMGNKQLCDVHHVNGVKSDNAASNLRVLCKDCHRKQPMHGGIFISSNDMQIIRSLRASQGKLKASRWDEVYDLSDTSIHGDLAVLQDQGFPPPEVGFDVLNGEGAVIMTLEAAWPNRKVAVNLIRLDLPGWQVHQVGDICGGLD